MIRVMYIHWKALRCLTLNVCETYHLANPSFLYFLKNRDFGKLLTNPGVGVFFLNSGFICLNRLLMGMEIIVMEI
jgi:hypothetical protein